MTDAWQRKLTAIGLSSDAAAAHAPRYQVLGARLPGGTPAHHRRAWWVPGRIEVLGKHTDYGGGRSLLCAVERGFQVIAQPRTDGIVSLIEASTGARESFPFAATTPSRPGHWTDYPISVIRRLARDAGVSRGADIAFDSSLPQASGMSSSSALVIATYLALSSINELDANERWQRALPDDDAVAGYLGAVENGKAFAAFAADNGVGTHGGSEDQTAILRSAPDRLAQYRFLPVAHERTVMLPREWTFAVAMSGVHAAKGGGAQVSYNRLAAEMRSLLDIWNAHAVAPQQSLLAALESSPDAMERLAAWVVESANGQSAALHARLRQFHAESMEIIPAVTDLISVADISAIAPLVARSQELAESTLANQCPETISLVRAARTLGAPATSAFGAGFGGSVWALVPTAGAGAFAFRWRDAYAASFPRHAGSAEFFVTRPGPGAARLPDD
jgi:galactokinase